MLKKQSILQIKNVYTANAFTTGNRLCVGAGSETEPVVQLYDMATGTFDQLDSCPGGMMSFVPVPNTPDAFVTIMGLFPPFIGNDAGLYLHRKTDVGWETNRAMDLPFAHRCEFLPLDDQTVLVAATVSKYKANPADWSNPGETLAISLDESIQESWEAVVIDSAIHRNHGLCRTSIDGNEVLCVSGAEGIFAIALSSAGSWELVSLFGNEVSEMAFIDLDGDGLSELVTIEPFHGNTFNIYKQFEGDWKLKFRDSLSFGHGLCAGLFNGSPIIVAGNRSDSLALEVFTVNNLENAIVDRMVIEENAGPTQTQIFRFGETDYILSANQRKNEVALYSGLLKD